MSISRSLYSRTWANHSRRVPASNVSNGIRLSSATLESNTLSHVALTSGYSRSFLRSTSNAARAALSSSRVCCLIGSSGWLSTYSFSSTERSLSVPSPTDCSVLMLSPSSCSSRACSSALGSTSATEALVGVFLIPSFTCASVKSYFLAIFLRTPLTASAAACREFKPAFLRMISGFSDPSLFIIESIWFSARASRITSNTFFWAGENFMSSGTGWANNSVTAFWTFVSTAFSTVVSATGADGATVSSVGAGCSAASLSTFDWNPAYSLASSTSTNAGCSVFQLGPNFSVA